MVARQREVVHDFLADGVVVVGYKYSGHARVYPTLGVAARADAQSLGQPIASGTAGALALELPGFSGFLELPPGGGKRYSQHFGSFLGLQVFFRRDGTRFFEFFNEAPGGKPFRGNCEACARMHENSPV